MMESVPLFLHLFGVHPFDMTYQDWQNCRAFADSWEKAQQEGG